MKVVLLLFSLVFCSAVLRAQSAEHTVKDFTLQLSSPSIEINRGATGKLDVAINKSRQFQKSSVTLGTASSLPAGVTVMYEPSSGVINSSVVNISVTADASPGTYSLILSGTINQKTKGVIVKLTIR
jgi:hypothetical protein